MHMLPRMLPRSSRGGLPLGGPAISQLARLRGGQFDGAVPARDPGLHLSERDRLPRALELFQAAAILRRVGAGNVHHGIEQSDGFRQHGGDILSAFGGELAQPRVGGGVDLQRAADHVHGCFLAYEWRWAKQTYLVVRVSEGVNLYLFVPWLDARTS